MIQRPAPASPEARAEGCTCPGPEPVLAPQAHRGEVIIVIAKGCPVHDSYTYGLDKIE